ncbi:MAG: hypothetical protein K2Q12_05220 [Rickettsiales bacterium]|nr:hypothetical protein [Rickettsiales bacterium]
MTETPRTLQEALRQNETLRNAVRGYEMRDEACINGALVGAGTGALIGVGGRLFLPPLLRSPVMSRLTPIMAAAFASVGCVAGVIAQRVTQETTDFLAPDSPLRTPRVDRPSPDPRQK